MTQRNILDTRNVVSDEQAEINRYRGGYTFNAFPPDDYEGLVWVYGALRIGDHAHLVVHTGRQHIQRNDEPRISYGGAGHLIVKWPEWLLMRDALDAVPFVRIAEVERPTVEQIEYQYKEVGAAVDRQGIWKLLKNEERDV
jgi:hypothetical protein